MIALQLENDTFPSESLLITSVSVLNGGGNIDLFYPLRLILLFSLQVCIYLVK